MKLSRELTTVTVFSKTLALVLFFTLPIFAFTFGMNYENIMERFGGNFVIGQSACTEEAKICPDGSSVGRSGPKCEFAACPSVAGVEISCGGFVGIECPRGHKCQMPGDYPDAMGVCVKGYN